MENRLQVPCYLEQRKSNKSGKLYYCLVVTIAKDVEKVVFLDNAEVALISLLYNKNK